MISDLKKFYQNQPISIVRQRLQESKQLLRCLKLMIDEGWFEEAHLLQVRTHTELRVAILEEIIQVSDDTIKALKQG